MIIPKKARAAGNEASRRTMEMFPVASWTETASKGATKRERSSTESNAPIDVPICFSENISVA